LALVASGSGVDKELCKEYKATTARRRRRRRKRGTEDASWSESEEDLQLGDDGP